MLSSAQKLEILNGILSKPGNSYADSFYNDITYCIESLDSSTMENQILQKINNHQECSEWLQKLTSRIVLHEHEDGINEIIFDYIFCG